MPDQDLLTIAQVADRLGVGRKFVERRIARKEIPVFRFGTAVRIKPADLDRYMADHYSETDTVTVPPAPPTPPSPSPRRRVRRPPPPPPST